MAAAHLGLFGGTFDPPHWGHYLVARAAMEQLRLDRVIFIPCRRSPHKPGRRMAPTEHRLALLRALLRGESWAGISKVELDRVGPSYSVDTAEFLARQHQGAVLHWIMGSDQWDALPQWREPERLAALVRFAVFPRPGPPRPRRGFRLDILEGRHDISASAIRRRVAGGLPVKGLVPDAVERYIRSHRLYLS